jgi:hypothetical protein
VSGEKLAHRKVQCNIAVQLNFFCGDERYVALTLIGDLAKQNFAEKHHII